MTAISQAPLVQIVTPFICCSGDNLSTRPGIWLEHHLLMSSQFHGTHNLELPGSIDALKKRVDHSIALVLVAVVSHPRDLAAFELAEQSLGLVKPECTYLLVKRTAPYWIKPGDISQQHLKGCNEGRARLRTAARKLNVPVLTSAANDYDIVEQTFKAMRETRQRVEGHYRPY